MAKAQSKQKPNWILKRREEILDEHCFLSVHSMTFNYALHPILLDRARGKKFMERKLNQFSYVVLSSLYRLLF